ncbi:phosphoserine phosphatase [Sphingomonas zeicaulis]|uniref:phosphoserine phosphatase SerB n=1 Tax=Sphingomonas zeicaulis TaxID=1632740 RepID=UPI003D1D7626
MYIATLIALTGLEESALNIARDAAVAAGGQPGEARWIESGIAADLALGAEPFVARDAIEAALPGIDVIVQRPEHRLKTLLVADMDSTMITVECIDELADYAGIKPQVAEVTERAMRGELDFEAALDARVGLLRDMDATVLDRCLAERVKIMPGAKALVRTVRARGGTAILVSGGFTHFADSVAEQIGFNRAISNRLGVADGRLDGTVARPIVGAETKREVLIGALESLSIGAEQSIAIGDGANDLLMIGVAGLGVAYHAKPKVAAAADARVRNGDLSVLLYAMGLPRAEWASAD